MEYCPDNFTFGSYNSACAQANYATHPIVEELVLVQMDDVSADTVKKVL